jgi:hypothetical protein
MGRHKKLSAEELEEKIDEYNRLVIRETELLKQYVEVKRLSRIMIANNIKKTSMKLLLLESIIDKNSK